MASDSNSQQRRDTLLTRSQQTSVSEVKPLRAANTIPRQAIKVLKIERDVGARRMRLEPGKHALAIFQKYTAAGQLSRDNKKKVILIFRTGNNKRRQLLVRLCMT